MKNEKFLAGKKKYSDASFETCKDHSCKSKAAKEQAFGNNPSGCNEMLGSYINK